MSAILAAPSAAGFQVVMLYSEMDHVSERSAGRGGRLDFELTRASRQSGRSACPSRRRERYRPCPFHNRRYIVSGI